MPSEFAYQKIENRSQIYGRMNFGRMIEPANPVAFLIRGNELLDVRIVNPTLPYYEILSVAYYEGISFIPKGSEISSPEVVATSQ